MATQAPTTPERQDRRGTPPGKGSIVPAHGGRIGNPPFVPTPEQRETARHLAKGFPPAGERFIARLMGISRDTLRLHFADDMELGRAEMLAAVATQFINRAIDVEAKSPDGKLLAKGDPDNQKFILARLAGWSSKIEHSGPEGGPIETKFFDLSNLTLEQKKALLPVIDQLLAQTPEDAEFVEVPDDEPEEGEEAPLDATPGAD